MNQKVKLPVDRLRAVRDEIWTDLRQPGQDLAQEAYARLLMDISDPIAVRRVRLVSGTTSLQCLLNIIIFLRRLFWPAVVFIVVISLLESWLLLFCVPVVIVLDRYVVNRLQTGLNVELAARLLVLDENIEDLDSINKK